jgi:hypothetical protein
MGRTAFGDNDRNRRLRHESQTGDPQPDDELATWSREQKMDRRFVARDALAGWNVASVRRIIGFDPSPVAA